MTDQRMNPDLIHDVLDVLDRHGYARADDEHTGRAILLISDLAHIYEGAQDHPFGPYINEASPSKTQPSPSEPAAQDLDFGMTRDELEVLATPLVERTFAVCQEASAVARLPVSAFDKVVLVGGSTRVPMVRPTRRAVLRGRAARSGQPRGGRRDRRGDPGGRARRRSRVGARSRARRCPRRHLDRRRQKRRSSKPRLCCPGRPS